MNEDLDDINIVHIKLITQDDVIAIVLDREEDPESVLRLQRPMEIKMMIDDDGNGMFVFYDWLPFSTEETCIINPNHIISVVQCDSSVKEEYIAACLDGYSEETTSEDTSNDPSTPTANGKVIKFPTSNKYH